MENGLETPAIDLPDEFIGDLEDDSFDTVEAILCVQYNMDEGAWRYLFKQYYGSVYAVIMRRLKNGHDAHEVAQQTFERAFRKIHQLEEPRKFAGWIKRIAIRLSINHATRRKKVSHFSQINDQKDTHMSTYMNHIEDTSMIEAPDQMIRREIINAVQETIGELRPIDRSMLDAFYVRRESLKEISAWDGAPVGTIKRRLFYARQRLQSLLRDRHPDLVELI